MVFTVLTPLQTLYLKANDKSSIIDLLSLQGFILVDIDKPLVVGSKEYHLI